ASYVPIDISPGETISIGTLFLQAYGTVAGTILGQDTDAPVPGSLLRACQLWGADNCSDPVGVSPSGTFELSGAPGPYVLIAQGPGYQDQYVDTVLIAGGTTTIFPIYLIPVGTSELYALQGAVVGGANLDPLDGAVVTAGSNFATATNASGDFLLYVPWGTYTLSAQDNGYATESRTVTVHSDLDDLNFVLPEAVYSVSGTIHDGLTGSSVGNVAIDLGGTQVATADDLGNYALELPNGTFTLEAIAPGGSLSSYAPVGFTVGVSGASVVRNLLLYPGSAGISGLVVNGLTGAPINNATVVISGSTQDGLPINETFVTTAQGTFDARVYYGTYAVNAAAADYLAAKTTTVSVSSAATLPVTLSLTPVSTGATGASGGIGLGPALLLAGVAAVGVIAFLGLSRWRAESPQYGGGSVPAPRAESAAIRQESP
ncbi:MAG: carboxypeptidase regulatory-like domain-containing protein, partial [Thermoplasmata archaeon]